MPSVRGWFEKGAMRLRSRSSSVGDRVRHVRLCDGLNVVVHSRGGGGVIC